MKQLVKNLGTILLAAALLLSCAGDPGAKGTKETADKTKKAKSLSLDEKAKNTFKNTMVIFTGAMVLAFSDMFKDQAEAFSEAFNAEMNEADLEELDLKISEMKDGSMSQLEEMIDKMDSAFDDLAKTNITIYEKMFLHDVMKEGVAITEKYDLPAGFKPLSHDLTDQEIKRYIVKVTSDGEDMEDPVIKTYMELFEWFQKVGEEFNADPEIQSFLEGLRG